MAELLGFVWAFSSFQMGVIQPVVLFSRGVKEMVRGVAFWLGAGIVRQPAAHALVGAVMVMVKADHVFVELVVMSSLMMMMTLLFVSEVEVKAASFYQQMRVMAASSSVEVVREMLRVIHEPFWVEEKVMVKLSSFSVVVVTEIATAASSLVVVIVMLISDACAEVAARVMVTGILYAFS